MRIVLLFLIALVVIFAPLSARGDVYLRVIGSDDTAEAQTQKIAVRDAVLNVCEDNKALTPSLYDSIQSAAKSVAPCDISFIMWQPSADKKPSPTVRITVGNGEGRNWWGVLYEDSLSFFSEENESESDGVVFRWVIWEYIKELLGL